MVVHFNKEDIMILYIMVVLMIFSVIFILIDTTKEIFVEEQL